MANNGKNGPIQPGEEAPGFTLPAVNRDGQVSLEEYRGKASVYLALHRGLHCPFCRRRLASLDVVREKLAKSGVEALAVVISQPERARLYVRYRPIPILLAADPERSTHEAFGVPLVEVTEEGVTDWPRTLSVADIGATRFDTGGLLPEPATAPEVVDALNAQDGFELTESDEQLQAAFPMPLEGQFLIDRNGIVRWQFIEAPHAFGEMTQLPSADEIIAAAASNLSA